MATNKPRSPRLGRGLSMLLAKPTAVMAGTDNPLALSGGPEGTAAPSSEATTHRMLDLDINDVQPNPNQPRQNFDLKKLNQLAHSIKTAGLIQPIVVRRESRPEDQVAYQLVAGERRWRAAKIAGLARILAIIRDLDDQQTAEYALIENLQREDLNPIERAQGFESLIEGLKLTHDQVAHRVGVDRTTITNALRLLSLDRDIQTLITNGAISAGQAKALAGITDHALQLELAKRAIQHDWSVRQLESEVRSRTQQGGKSRTTQTDTSSHSPHLDDLQQQIAQQLGTKVRIRQGKKKGTGSLEIDFFSLDQFDALLSRFGIETQ